MSDKRISQLVARVSLLNNDVLPIVASGSVTTNKVSLQSIDDYLQANLEFGVTSVAITTPTGLTVTGSPITSTGTFVISFTAGYSIPTNASQATWDTAYTNRITSATAPLGIASNVISITQSGAASNGYLSSTDWNIFNNGTQNLQSVLNIGNTATANIVLTGNITATKLIVNTNGQSKDITTFYGTGTTGENIFIGGGGLLSSGSGVNGSYNTSLGGSSFQSNTIGSRCTAIGYDALSLNTTGNQNTAVGARSLTLNTTGIQNTAVGLNALYGSTTGDLNTGIGRQSMTNNSTGYSNTGIGHDTLYLNTTGYQNFAGGKQALYNNTTGFNNIAIGNSTGTTNTTGSNNIFIGNGTAGLAATDSNRTFIGNSSTTSTYLAGNVLIGTTTDSGYKLDVNGSARVQGGLIAPLLFNRITTTYTLVLTDQGKMIEGNFSSNSVITIPLASSVNFPIGTELSFVKRNTGNLQIVGDTGVTVNSAGSLYNITTQYGAASLVKVGANEWYLYGNLT